MNKPFSFFSSIKKMGSVFKITRFNHPIAPMFFYIPLASLLIFFSLFFHPRSLLSVFLNIFFGFLLWGLVEYLFHRFISHLTYVKEPWRTLASGVHMKHHSNPNDEDFILLSLKSSFTCALFLYFILLLITFSPTQAALIETGLITGYLVYEWVHYAAHHYSFQFSVGKYLKQYHLLHHFKYPTKIYGVTSPIWDYLLGTFVGLELKKGK